MQKIYNTMPDNIIAVIGPAISFKHFETYPLALEQLKSSVANQNDFQNSLFSGNFADLKGINKRQLNELGVKKIDVCPYCTVDDNDKFFSYRKENKTTMRHSAVLKLSQN